MSPVKFHARKQHDKQGKFPPDPLDTIKKDLQKLFWMLGLALTLPTVLLSGPFAGYLISRWLIVKWGWAPGTTLVLVLLGLVGSAVQTVRVLRLLYKGSEKKDL
ncbi:MAG: hypothetical protein V1882_04225 [Candidatus Omnitrophota bacterium]